MKLATLLAWLRDGLIVLALIFLLVLSAGAFAYPWVSLSPTLGSALERYSPVRDGSSSLSIEYDSNDVPLRWISTNTGILQNARALATDLRKGARQEMMNVAKQQGIEGKSDEDTLGNLAGIQIIETQRREIDAKGAVSESVMITMRDARGEYLVSIYYPKNNSEVVYDPPALLLPADVTRHLEWTTDGKVGNNTYALSSRVVEIGSVSTPLGDQSNCLLVASQVTTKANGQQIQSNGRDWYCPGMGIVAGQILDASGGLISRRETVAIDEVHASDVSTLPPLKQPVASETSLAVVDSSWALYRLGRLGRGVSASESAVPPLWIAGDPPLVLAAGYDSDLVAYDAAQPGLTQVWAFHTGGTVYGPPAYDTDRAYIYFGSTDKRLYAVDRRGLFLWSFLTGDSVATRPVIVGDVVIFGSEDGNVYGVDANSGKERWRFGAGGPVVSSPALAAGTAVIGCDEGQVFGLDPSTGQLRWQFEAQAGIEAPITAVEATAYAASRDGQVYAIDAGTGEQIWSTRPTNPLRTAPVVGSGRVFVVNDSSRLVAYDAENGKFLWQTKDAHYAGAPLVVGETLVVSGDDANVYRFSLDGEKQGQWSLNEQTNVEDSSNYLSLGPTLGGDTVWLADHKAGLWRLGAQNASASLVPLKLTWAETVGNPPFALYPVVNTVVEYAGKGLAIDGTFNVYQVDPANGSAARLGTLAPQAGDLKIEPIVSGDTLLTIFGDTLYATHLPDLKPLWQVKGDGFSMRPAVISDNTVLWLSAPTTVQAGKGEGTINAINLATGAVKWKSALAGFSTLGGAVARDHVAYVSTPPLAFDLETGDIRWRADLLGGATAAPALDESGNALFVAAAVGETGAVAALSTADGHVLWRVESSTGLINPLERIWLSHDVLIYSTLGGKIAGLDATNGKELWSYTLTAPQVGTITVENGIVWFTLQNSRITALDAATGKTVAQFTDLELNLNGVGFTERPTRIGDRLMVAIGAAILGLDAGKVSPR